MPSRKTRTEKQRGSFACNLAWWRRWRKLTTKEAAGKLGVAPSSYAGFYIWSSSAGLAEALSVRDWDTAFYHDNSGQTTVPRSLGWHKLKTVVDGSGASASIDGAFVSTVTAMTSFDGLQVWGGQWRFAPNSTYVFDDFAVSSVPEPSVRPLLLLSLGGLWHVLRRRRE